MKNLWHEWYFNNWIQTFMKSDYADLSNIENYDISFVWIPCDIWASYRKWTSLWPKFVREYSYWDDVNWWKFYDLDNNIYLDSNNLKICDLWDIHINPTDLAQTEKNIENTITDITKKSFPLIVWGDHSIAYYTIKWFISWLNGVNKEDVAILHLDAHTDVEDKYIDMPRIYHWSPFRYLIEDGIINSKNLFTVGVRWVIPIKLINYINDKWINLFTMDYINKIWVEKFFCELLEKLRIYKYIYITLDVDCIDPSELKWTWTPLEGWFKSKDIHYFLRQLKTLNVYWFEVVELSPNLDLSWYSNMIVCNLLWHFLSFWYTNHRI